MIVLFDGPQEEKLPLENIPTLYQMKERFLNTIKKYLS